jgi:hypothetical protein
MPAITNGLLVLGVVPLGEEDESPFVALLQVEAAYAWPERRAEHACACP